LNCLVKYQVFIMIIYGYRHVIRTLFSLVGNDYGEGYGTVGIADPIDIAHYQVGKSKGQQVIQELILVVQFTYIVFTVNPGGKGDTICLA